MEDDDVPPAIHHDEGSTHLQAQHNEAATIDWTNVEAQWAAGGEEQVYYSMRPEVARAWLQSEK
jgi:hypothetical protein